MKLAFFRTCGFVLFVALSSEHTVCAQSSASMTQTVAQRNTIGMTTVTPSGTVPLNSSETFSYVLHTAGAPAPTSETVQFYDGANAIGTAQTIGSLAATNLLPYSQVNTAQSWQVNGAAPTVTPNTGNGPDGSTSTATQIAFPATGSTMGSGVTIGVPGTSYANKPMTLSVWARSTSPTSLTLSLGDAPYVAAAGFNACYVTNVWQRCTFTYTFPSNAGTGVSASFISATNSPAQTVSVWGAQVEQASTAGPFVSTVGSARPSGGQGGTVSFAYSALQPGSHSITAVYAGDANYVSSTSNAVTVVVNQATPTIALTPSIASPAIYGQAVTFTAALTPPNSVTQVPTGSVQFFDGATSLGTVNVDGSGNAALTLSGPTLLNAGSHSIKAVYSGDSTFSTVNSSVLTYVVNKASSTLTATSSLNPSIYGDSVIFTVQVSSAGAVPTGTVLVQDGSTTLGTPALDGTGSATITVPLFTAGTHTIHFAYSGDSNHN